MTSGEPTLDDLRREFPRWTFFTGVNHRPYARLPLSSPPVVLIGRTPPTCVTRSAATSAPAVSTTTTAAGLARLRNLYPLWHFSRVELDA